MLDAAPGGGTAFPFSGSSGDAYLIALSIGHGVIKSLLSRDSNVVSGLVACNCLIVRVA